MSEKIQDQSRTTAKGPLVWDVPTRLFHWALVILITISFYTGLTGGFDIMDYHMLSGYGILSLIIFRLIWGFTGNRHARFTGFVRGPAAVMAYLREIRTQRPTPGHNPLGALSVIAILLAILVQAGTGLFASDDIFTEGPLVHLIDAGTSGSLTEIHELMMYITGGLIGLHIAAILWYRFGKQTNLVKPMLTGRWFEVSDTEEAANPWLRGLFVMLLSAGGVYALVTWV
ncbi:MAG: cytochrome b/b6 domain-containing protein [Pseudomonadales bacterium]|nr:cytochrome b/b6 domain-containing protein [Pseudomonadales bacterium]